MDDSGSTGPAAVRAGLEAGQEDGDRGLLIFRLRNRLLAQRLVRQHYYRDGNGWQEGPVIDA